MRTDDTIQPNRVRKVMPVHDGKPPTGILAMDIDGTLTGFNGPIGERTQRAVHAAGESGWIVTIATGRSWVAAKPVADKLQLRLPIITHNGALVRDSVTTEILHYLPLSASIVGSIVPALVELGLQPVVVEDIRSGDRLFTGPETHDGAHTGSWLERLQQVHGMTVERIAHEQLCETGQSTRVELFDERNRLGGIELIASGRETDFRVLASPDMPGPAELVQFLHPRSTKAAAIEWLAMQYGLTLGDVVAVGDGFNDIEMLTEAGFGVAMGNASAQVQAEANITIGHHRDEGLASFIEERLLRVSGVADLKSLVS